MITRKIAVLFTGAALALSMSACGARDGAKEEKAADSGPLKVGIAMPQKTSQNWVEAEGIFKSECEAAKIECDLQFANGGVSEQQGQISAMISNGVKVLLIGAIDGSQLSTQVKEAKAAGIKVVSYDRLLLNTPDQDYYIAYDSFEVGKLQGKALLDGMKAKKAQGPYNVELFAGSPDDANSLKFFNGAMEVLKPAIDKGEVVVGSGQSKFENGATQGWDPKNAQTRMDSLLTSTYSGDKTLDGVLSPNDTLARAIITSIEQAKKPLPVVTGQDSEDESVSWVAQGKQYSTIFKDTAALVKESVNLAVQLGQDKEPKLEGVNFDDKSYEAMPGKPVKSFLLTPQIVTKENAAEVYKNDKTRSELVKKAQG